MNIVLAMASAVAVLMTASMESTAQSSYIMPDRVKVVNYNLSIDEQAAMYVNVGGRRYRVTSKFSTTSPNKWNGFGEPEGKPAKSGWRVSVRKLSGKEYRVFAQDADYRLTRLIKVRPDHVDVSDKFTNLRNSLIGIMFENSLSGYSAKPVMRVGGLSDEVAKGPNTRFKVADDGSYTMSGACRPYVQLSESNKSSVGMVAVDDVFRVQAEMSRKTGGVSISDNHFGLAPKAAYTVNWQIYPVEEGDHYSFINRVRRVWDTNHLIDGPFSFFHTVLQGQKTDDELRDLLKTSGVKFGCFVVSSDRVRMEAFGSAYISEADTKRKQIREQIARMRRLDPELKIGVYHHGYLDNSLGASNKFRDCRILTKDGEQYSFMVYFWANPENEKVPYLYPTTTNLYGVMQRKLIREQLADTDGDGVYWDEMEMNVWSVHPTYTYGAKDWDGHSVEIDPETHLVTQKITNITLISQPFTQEKVEFLKRNGNIPYCNYTAATKTSTNWRLPRFLEFVNPYWASEAHLTTPLGLGDSGDMEGSIIKRLHDFLDLGLLYVYHVGIYNKEPSGIVRRIYPITPLEVHEGYIIGKEKTVTNRSGAYGWGDKTFNGSVFIYGADGKLSEKNGERVSKDGMAFVKIDLDPGEVAVVTRNSKPSG